MPEKAPYGSKLIRVVLAALDLYEFTPAQLVNHAGLDITLGDFENAKREGNKLEVGRVLIELRLAKTQRIGRPSKIYTFRNPEEFEKLRSWASLYQHDPEMEGMDKSTPNKYSLPIDGESKQVVDLEKLIIDLKSENLFTKDKLLWARRGLKHLIDRMSEFSEDEIAKKLKYQLRLIYVRKLITQQDDNIPLDRKPEIYWGLLEQLVGIGAKNENLADTVRLAGYIDVGISLIDDFSALLYKNIALSVHLRNYSTKWQEAQWEVWNKRFDVFLNRQDDILRLILYKYWLGCYSSAIAQIMQNIEAQNLSNILQLLDNKPISVDNLLKRAIEPY